MGDKWRFDPNMDYTAEDEYSDSRQNFERFTKKKNKKRNQDENYDIKKRKNKSWR